MNPIQKRKLFILFGLCLIEGVIVFIILTSIPVDPKNRSYMGYSALRFMVLFLILLGILFFTTTILLMLKKKNKPISNIISALQKGNRSIYLLEFIGLIFSLFLLLSISFLFINSDLFSIYYTRLMSLFIWGDLICTQGLFILPSVLFDCGIWEGIKRFIAKIRNYKNKSFKEIELSEKTTLRKLLLPLLFLVAVLFPSSNLMLFQGLPISSLPIYIAIILSLPLIFSKRFLNSFYGIISQKLRYFLSIIFIIVILFKLALLVSGVYDGFLACYRTPLRTPANGKCELSYNNPFFRNQATRIDKTINFREKEWGLSFINDNFFNYYQWEPGNILRDRIPLDITWMGNGKFLSNQELIVTYVGTGEIKIGNSITYLESSYQNPYSRTIVVPQGQVPLEINYHFDDGYRTGQSKQPGPRPMMIIEVGKPEGHFSLLKIKTPLIFWKIIALISDAVFVISIIALFLFYLNLLWEERWSIYLMTLVGLISFLGFPDYGYVAPSILFLFLYYKKHDHYQFILMYFLVVIFGMLSALHQFPNLNYVFYRSAGQDMLTYESFARNILETHSLQGGEPIFFYQPFYRYVLYAAHMLFGDGDALILASELAILNFACFSAVYKVIKKRISISKYQKTAALVAATMLIIFLNSQNARWLIQGISEYPTWIFLLFSFYFFNSVRTIRNWIFTVMLLALSFITRTNQFLGISLFFLIFFIWVWKVKKRNALIGLFLFIGIVSLPAWHNFFFGGQFVLLPTSSNIAVNLVLSPGQFFNQFNNPDTQRIFWNQMHILIGLSPEAEWMTTLSMQIIMILWLTAVIWGIRNIKRNLLLNLLFLILPIFYLGVHIFYVSDSYYPRHLTVGYIALAMVAIQYLLIPRDHSTNHKGGLNIV